MVAHRPRRGETLRDAAGVLKVMGQCRAVLVEAQDGVKPFGTMFQGCGMVIAAIDALACLLTGQPHYFNVEGSTPAPGQRRWDSDRSGPGGG